MPAPRFDEAARASLAPSDSATVSTYGGFLIPVAVSTRVHGLWFAWLACWAGALLVYGAVSPAAVAASSVALALLNFAAIVLLPGPLMLSRSAAVFLLVVVLLFLIQLVPGLGFLFPWTSALRATHGAAGTGPGTADAFLTVRQGAQIFAYALTAILTLRLVQAGLSRALAVSSLVAVLSLEGLYAAAQQGFRWESIPFFGKRLDLTSATGTLVNRNNFAGLMAMGVALAAGAAWGRFATRRRGRAKISPVEAGLPWAVAAALLAAGIVISQSRGGALAAVAGLLALGLVWKRQTRGAGVAGAIVLAVAGGATMWAANTEPLIERFQGMEGKDLTLDTRVLCWKATLAGAARQPVLGFGIGAYPRAFRPFQPATLTGQFQHAHSEYVNAAFEGGAAWALLLVGGLALWLARAIRGLPTLDSHEHAAAVAAIAAVLAAAVHALVDFDLRITGIGILFAALLGLAPAWSEVARPIPRVAWAAAALVTLAFAATLGFAPLDPEGKASASASLDPAAAEISLHRTLALSPCDGAAAWYLARTAERRGDLELAATRFETAARIWPANPRMQLEAGVWLWLAGKRTAGSACLRRAFEGRSSAVEEALGRIWEPGEPVGSWEALIPGPASGAGLASFLAKRGRWQEAASVFQRLVPATQMNVSAYDELAEAFGEAGQWGLEATTREARLGVISDASAYTAAARAWARLQAWDKALGDAQSAARLSPGQPEGPLLLAEILEGKGDRMAAAEAITDAFSLQPGDPELLLRRARLYFAEGLFPAAADDARAAVDAAPGRREAVLLLARALAGAGRREDALAELDAYLTISNGDEEARRLRSELGGK